LDFGHNSSVLTDIPKYYLLSCGTPYLGSASKRLGLRPIYLPFFFLSFGLFLTNFDGVVDTIYSMSSPLLMGFLIHLRYLSFPLRHLVGIDSEGIR